MKVDMKEGMEGEKQGEREEEKENLGKEDRKEQLIRINKN